jgi:hypothetical protein
VVNVTGRAVAPELTAEIMRDETERALSFKRNAQSLRPQDVRALLRPWLKKQLEGLRRSHVY